MNVGFFSEMERIDGAAIFMLRQARWLAANGHHPVIFSPAGPLVEQIEQDGIVHVPIPSARQGAPPDFEQLVADAARLSYACEQYGIEAILASARLPFPMACFAVGERIPIFYPVLSDKYFPPNAPNIVVQVQKAGRDGRLLGYSFESSAIFERAFNLAQGTVRHSYFPMDDEMRRPAHPRAEVRATLGIAENEVLVLTVTRLDIDKAGAVVPTAIAVEALAKRGYRVRFVVVGDGSLGAAVRAQSPTDTIFLGVRSDLADLYHACDIYVGEGTTIFEAAVAGRPVVISCAAFHAEHAAFAFSVYGFHVLDHAFLAWTHLAPPERFEAALEPLVASSALRDDLGRAAQETVTAHNLNNVTMPWLLDVLAGKPNPPMVSTLPARAILEVAGGTAAGIDRVGMFCARYGDRLAIGVRIDDALPWARTYAMPVQQVQALARAVRRSAEVSTPRSRVTGDALENPSAMPQDIVSAWDALADDLPPTSVDPPLAFDPPRARMHLVVASNVATLIELVRALDLPDNTDGVVAWVPSAAPSDAFERVSAATAGEVMLISQPLAWTIVGRIFVAACSYADDGSLEFEHYRRLAAQFGLKAGIHNN